jgi:MFS family permease
MVFLIAYAIFEVPSNYFLKKLSPSKWIAFLMFSWGAITMGLGGTQNFAGVTAVRFILGMFEAGSPPSEIFWLFLTEHRSLPRAGILPYILVPYR